MRPGHLVQILEMCCVSYRTAPDLWPDIIVHYGRTATRDAQCDSYTLNLGRTGVTEVNTDPVNVNVNV